MRSWLVAVAVSLAAHPAFAQPAVTLAPPGMVEPQPAPPPAGPTGSKKSVATAMWLSLGTTLGGLGLVIVQDSMNAQSGTKNQWLGGIGSLAFVVGPSLGHAYAGHTWNLGLGIRLGSLGVSMLSLLPLMTCFAEARPAGSGGSGSNDACTVGMVGLVGGGIGYLAGTVTEIALVPSAVERENRYHGWAPQVSVAPIRTPSGVAPGLVLGGRF